MARRTKKISKLVIGAGSQTVNQLEKPRCFTSFKLLPTSATVSMDPKQFKCENKLTPEDQVAITCTLLSLSTEVLIEILAYIPAVDMHQ
jgi:hypothetical protein